MTLILASGSPRRRELLHGIGIDFEVRPADVPEVRKDNEPVDEYVLRLAREKAYAVARTAPDRWVLAADTVVFIDRHVLEKPLNEEDAVKMLSTLSGRTHTVFTGVALQRIDREYLDTRVAETDVKMITLTEQEIRWYVGTGEPLDKAGAYAVQGIGAMFIEAVEGNYTNVVGLPLAVVFDMLRKAGLDPLDPRCQRSP